MHVVPSFGRTILRYLDAPGGRITTYTEIQLEDEDGTVSIPDGAIVVKRGRTHWVTLVEVKTGTSELAREQINRYLRLANRYGFDALLTISKQIVSSPAHSPVRVDKRSLKGLTLRHLSWSRVFTEAMMEHEHRGVDDPEQAWILGELIAYLDHEKSGASGFEGMGREWVGVRNAARQGTLRPFDEGVKDVAEGWQQFIEYLALGLRQDLGEPVRPVYPRKSDAPSRLQGHIDSIGRHARLEATLAIPNAVGQVDVVADLRSRLVTTSVRVQAPKEGRAKTRVNWLIRQLKDAPGDVRIEARFPRARQSTSLLLSDAREDPSGLFLPADLRRTPKAFDVAIGHELGSKRGKGPGSFVALTRKQVVDFYRDVVQNLQAWTPRPPRLPKEPEEADTDVTAPRPPGRAGVESELIQTEEPTAHDDFFGRRPAKKWRDVEPGTPS